MKTKGPKVKVKQENGYFIGYLVEESEKKFIVTNEKGNVEMHYPKKDYRYTILEDK